MKLYRAHYMNVEKKEVNTTLDQVCYAFFLTFTSVSLCTCTIVHRILLRDVIFPWVIFYRNSSEGIKAKRSEIRSIRFGEKSGVILQVKTNSDELNSRTLENDNDFLKHGTRGHAGRKKRLSNWTKERHWTTFKCPHKHLQLVLSSSVSVKAMHVQLDQWTSHLNQKSNKGRKTYWSWRCCWLSDVGSVGSCGRRGGRRGGSGRRGGRRSGGWSRGGRGSFHNLR